MVKLTIQKHLSFPMQTESCEKLKSIIKNKIRTLYITINQLNFLKYKIILSLNLKFTLQLNLRTAPLLSPKVILVAGLINYQGRSAL